METNFFRFEHIQYLWALALIPLFTIGFILLLRWKRKSLARYGDTPLIARLTPWTSKSRPIIKFLFLMLAWFFLIVGLANPQMGSRLEKMDRKGIDIMIALDVSNSMLAQDIKPNRLERAKRAIYKLIDKLSNDRIGIVVFAGKAYIQLPITSDYAAAKMFLSSINTQIVGTQGTAIGEAIKTCVNAFDENEHSKAVVVITDGENHEDDAIKAAAAATDQGIKVYTIGMGLPEGAPIPTFKNGRQTGYKKDRMGQTVVTRLNRQLMEQVAAAGQGIFVGANNSQVGLKKIFEEINKLEKTKFESRVFSDYEDRFQYFIAVALLFLILEILLLQRKSRWLSKFKLFE